MMARAFHSGVEVIIGVIWVAVEVKLSVRKWVDWNSLW